MALKPVLYGSFAAHRAGVPAVVNALAGLGYLVPAPASRPGCSGRWWLPPCGAPSGANAVGSSSRIPKIVASLLSAGLVEPEQIVLMRGAGVALDQFFPAPEPPGPPVVLLPARMLWAKGVGAFVEAARILRRRGITARFVLAGRTDPDNPTAVPGAQLQAWADSGEVEWWGHREDIAEVLRQSAVVCLPSTYGEGVPKALLEAAATGRAIITTDTPGCREVVRDRENGLLVPPGDLAALVDALDLLLSDPQLRTRLGRVGRARAESEFAEADVIRPTLELYRELLDSAG